MLSAADYGLPAITGRLPYAFYYPIYISFFITTYNLYGNYLHSYMVIKIRRIPKGLKVYGNGTR